MADKKISQLTAATTPLAGTEVLPIVQSGATVKVSIADVTAGRAVSATSISAGLGAVGTPSYTFTGDDNTGMWSPAADTIAFSEGGAEAIRINSTGNVGVGTSAPTQRLDIRGGDVQVSRGAAGVTADGAINFGNSAANYIYSGNSSNIMVFATNSVERVRILAAGNVGINESAPDYQLDVNGTFGFTPGSSVTPVDNGDVVFELTSNTSLTVKAKGSDGVVRSAILVLV
jgi:hypothetical protein